MATVSIVPSDRNRRVGLYAGLFALLMLALGFASVPLYRMFCQTTGWGGTTQRATEKQAEAVKAVANTISVRFDGNVDPGLKWHFAPAQVSQTTRLGVRTLAVFTARNLTDHPITGRASFNVSPDETGKYFTKIQCFCFTEQTLAPGQEVRMPVVYYVDPSLLQDEDAKDTKQITLSYTFHEVRKAG
ncbi:MAG: cytochrome c oxidase assembly protein [Novosphingobium sp.]